MTGPTAVVHGRGTVRRLLHCVALGVHHIHYDWLVLCPTGLCTKYNCFLLGSGFGGVVH